jgi:signal transduction histidine kinase
VELVNPAFSSVEGRNILNLRDASGKAMVREYIDLAMRRGSGWTTYLWPRPDGSRTPVPKSTYVRRVVTPEGETLIVGAGLYEP